MKILNVVAVVLLLVAGVSAQESHWPDQDTVLFGTSRDTAIKRCGQGCVEVPGTNSKLKAKTVEVESAVVSATVQSRALANGLRIVYVSPAVSGLQGYATNGTAHYMFSTDKLFSYTNLWTLDQTNSNAFAGLPAGVDHVGDGEYHEGQLYAPAERYNGCADVGVQTVAVFDTTAGLPLASYHDISANGHEASSLTFKGGDIYLSSYCDGSKLWIYDAASFALKGTLPLSTSIRNIQGVSWSEAEGRFAITAGDDAQKIGYVYYVSPAGAVTGPVFTTNQNAEMEGVDYTQGEIRYLLNTRVQYLGKTQGIPLTVDEAGTVLSATLADTVHRRWESYMVVGNQTLVGYGDSLSVAGTATNASALSVGPAPMTVNWVTAATTGSAAGITGKLNIRGDWNASWQTWVQIPAANDYTATRVWVMWANATTTAAAPNSDDPKGYYVGFRASTVAGDTTWKCVSDRNGAGQFVADSGVPVNTLGHGFEVRADMEAIRWFIGGRQVCSSTANLPMTGTLSTYIQTITQADVAKNIRVSYVRQTMDTPQ